MLFDRKIFFHECYEILKLLLVRSACQDCEKDVLAQCGDTYAEEETWHSILSQDIESVCLKVLEIKR